MYGLPKITRNQSISLILDSMRENLERQGEFAGDSLSYYGIDVEWSLNMTFITREQKTVDAAGTLAIGETEVYPTEDGTEPEPVKVRAELRGQMKKGKTRLHGPGQS